MNFLRFLLRLLPFSGRCRKHEWVILGVLQDWEGSVGDGPTEPSFQRLAAECANCPQATPNLFRWVQPRDRERMGQYWYGTPLGQPIGAGVESGDPKVLPYDDTDLPRKARDGVKWEGFMDT